LLPLAAEQAQQYLNDLLQAWMAGLNAPLPLACRAGLALIHAEQTQAVTGKGNPMAKASEAYQGNAYDGSRGEVHYGNHQALRRAFPNFDALMAPQITAQADGEPAFIYWARRLYGPLLAHMEAADHE